MQTQKQTSELIRSIVGFPVKIYDEIHPIRQYAIAANGEHGLWFCKRCTRATGDRVESGPQLTDKGKPKIVSFRSGYAAVYLACGNRHVAAVAGDRVR